MPVEHDDSSAPARKRQAYIPAVGPRLKRLLFVVFALFVRHGFEREEGVVRLRPPRLPGELVGLGKLRTRRPRDAQSLARDGVGQRVGDSPQFLVVAAPAENAERSVEAT